MTDDLANRQAASGRQGAAFEATVETLLKVEGWTIVERHWYEPEIGIEVDIVADSPTGQRWWIECKGSWESPSRNGLERTDTLKKAIANGALLRLLDGHHPYMVIASHLPVTGRGVVWLERAKGVYIDEIRIVGTGEAT